MMIYPVIALYMLSFISILVGLIMVKELHAIRMLTYKRSWDVPAVFIFGGVVAAIVARMLQVVS